MNIKALITTLAIVGSSSIAMASPSVTYSASASFDVRFGTPTVQVRDHRTPVRVPVRTPVRTQYTWNPNAYNWDSYDSDADWNRPRYEPRYERGVSLGDEMFFDDHEYRKDIIPAAGMLMDKLQIESEAGQTYFMKVVVEFNDGGNVQQFDLNRTLRGNQRMTLDLSGSNRSVKRILIYRADELNYNKRHNGEFSVTAL